MPLPNSNSTSTSNLLTSFQALHNVNSHLSWTERGNIRDPILTEFGVDQCVYLQNNFPHMNKITHVLVSPLRRTLQTAALGFGTAIKRGGIPFIAWPDLRETGDGPCNWATSIKAVEQITRDQGIPIELGLLTEGWQDFADDYGIRPERVRKHLLRFQRALIFGKKWNGIDIGGSDTKDFHVLVVSHGGILSEVAGYLGKFQRCCSICWIFTDVV